MPTSTSLVRSSHGANALFFRYFIKYNYNVDSMYFRITSYKIVTYERMVSYMKIQQIRNATMKITYAGKRFLLDPMLAKKEF